jgi:hypothetical protein
MKKILLGLALVAAALLCTTNSAQASFQLRVSTDGGATFGAPVGDGGTGMITVPLGPLTLSAHTTNFISASFSSLDLAVSGVAAAGTYNLVVQETMDGIPTGLPAGITDMFTGSIIPSQLSTVAHTWINSDNTLFSTVGNMYNSGTLPLQSNVSSQTVGGSTPYSLTSEVRLTGTTGTNVSVSLDHNTALAVPAPAGLVLLAAGAPVFALGYWRRKKAAVKA